MADTNRPSDVALDEATAGGFHLALNLIEGLGVQLNRQEVINYLMDVGSGRGTVYASPEEEVAKLAREKGEPTPEERAVMLGWFADRRDMDANNRELAIRVIRQARRDGAV